MERVLLLQHPPLVALLVLAVVLDLAVAAVSGHLHLRKLQLSEIRQPSAEQLLLPQEVVLDLLLSKVAEVALEHLLSKAVVALERLLSKAEVALEHLQLVALAGRHHLVPPPEEVSVAGEATPLEVLRLEALDASSGRAY